MYTQRILIIDDHEPTRSTLRSILNRRGYEVFEAGTIAGGLALLDGLDPHPECVVLDMDLPDGSGETILRAIRKEQMPVRVAVCSGMSDPSRWAMVERLEPEAILQKPVDLAEVYAACGPAPRA